jgi:SIR2-like domain/HEAT repeats
LMAVSDLVPILAQEREDIVPLIGAGLCVDAGMPTGAVLAENLRQRSGLELEAADGDFGAVCREIEEKVGRGTLQQLAAAAVETVELVPTPSLKAIANCPSGLVLTTNYDGAIERSVREIGKKPVPICLDDERLGRRPKEGEVFVIHLHGIAERPETMVLSTAQRNELLEDEAFRSRLRLLVAGDRLLALGLRLSAEEPHLRSELGRLARLLGGPKPIVVLPEGEVDEALAILEADRAIELYRCDPAQDYLEVRQCAQLLAPRQLDPTKLITERAEGVSKPFIDPPLLGPNQLADAGDSDPAMTVTLAELRLGSLAPVGEMVEARRALLIGAPGRGKTMALRRLGEENKGRAVCCDLRNLRPDRVAPERGFARLAAREGEAFDNETPVPDTEALREGSFVFCLDGLEEAEIDDHAAVAGAILAAAERWPQHSYVVATRPTKEAQRLVDAGFTRFVVEGSEGWGRRYLDACGITNEQVEHLYDVVPMIGSQLAIPRYAARIAAELHEETEGVELARGAQERLVRGERKNLELAAQRLGVEVDELMQWALRLAVMIELRGENSASIDEIAALPGPGRRDSRAACEELVQAALLQDLPDRARFSAQVSQEALCAKAILNSSDAVAVLREIAMAEVDGRDVFREDIEHTLDLVFEGASEELRAQLRQLDKLRWARTQGPGDPAAVAEALEVIRAWHRRRRLWIPYRGDNQLRGPGEALKALHRAAPEALEERRAELNAECRDGERTIRGNAIEMLTLLPADEDTEPILRELVADPDAVVRRHAAHAIEHFELAGLTKKLWAAWDGEHDELALEAIGLALGKLCDEQELFASISLLRRKPKGWMRISHRVLERVDLPALAELLASGSIGIKDVEEVLSNRLEREEPFSPQEAQALGSILLSGGPRLHRQRHSERIAALVAMHPEEALAGARAAAGKGTRFIDLLWAVDLDPDLLALYAEGALAEPVEKLLERIGWREEVAAREFAPPEPPEEEEKPEDLATLLAEEEVGENIVPSDYWLLKLPGEPEEVKERFLALAEAWYPEDAAAAIKREGGQTTITNGFRGAVVVWATLEQPVSSERWLEILSAGIGKFSGRISEWMSGQWQPGWSAAAAQGVAALENPTDLALAAKAIPEWTPELRELFAERACRLEDESLSITVVERLRDFGDTERLRAIIAGDCGEQLRELTLVELAQLGDPEAERRLLERILKAVKVHPDAYEHAHNLSWTTSVTSPELVELLGELLRATHRCEDASMFRRVVEAGIRSIGHESCLALYDRLIADPGLEGGQFYWYQREALARSLARQEVLARFKEHGDPLNAVFDAA